MRNEVSPPAGQNNITPDAALVLPPNASLSPSIHKEIEEGITETERSIRLSMRGVYALVVIALAVFTFGIFWFGSSLESLSQLGSFLAGTAGILSSLAGLILIYVAFLGQRLQILNQRKEIRQNAEELELTRSELAGQKVQLQLQSETMRIQQFESTFFQLFDVLTSVINSLSLSGGVEQIGPRVVVMDGNGKRIFRPLVDVVVAHRQLLLSGSNSVDYRSASASAYEKVFREYEDQLGPYFRSLYHLTRFVHNSGLTYHIRKNYVDIVRAQLTLYELVFLLFNCQLGHGVERFKPLVEEYGLLKHIGYPSSITEADRSEFVDSAFRDHDESPGRA